MHEFTQHAVHYVKKFYKHRFANMQTTMPNPVKEQLDRGSLIVSY